MDDDPGGDPVGHPEEIPAYAKIKNTVRIALKKEADSSRGLKYVINDVLCDVGKAKKTDLLAIQDYPKRGVYEVSFNSHGLLQAFMEEVRMGKENPKLRGVSITEHVFDESKFVVIKMYSPHVSPDEIGPFLARYFKHVKLLGKIMNEFDVWTSKWKFLVRCYADPQAPGGVRLPPARFKLGQVNGDFYFNGMPPFCRKCKTYGHTRENCSAKCDNCGSTEHSREECKEGKRCFICQKLGHVASACPNRKPWTGWHKEQPKAPPQAASTEEQPAPSDERQKAQEERPEREKEMEAMDPQGEEQEGGEGGVVSHEEPQARGEKKSRKGKRRACARLTEFESQGSEMSDDAEPGPAGRPQGKTGLVQKPEVPKEKRRKEGRKGKTVSGAASGGQGEILTQVGEPCAPPKTAQPSSCQGGASGLATPAAPETPIDMQPLPPQDQPVESGGDGKKEEPPVKESPEEDLNGQPLEGQVGVTEAGLPDYEGLRQYGILSEGSSSPDSSLFTIESAEGWLGELSGLSQDF